LAVARPGEIVLLVEDEPAIRTALGRVLTGNGYRVLDASNGGEALRVAESEPGEIHVLLTDVMMPGIGGKELVQRFLKKRPTTRVILMSGFTDDLDLREELGTAKFLFLQKPFAARRVLSAVREVLDGA
jgi:DNA-binding NtrC family response regulator